MAELVDDLERLGIIERRPDPSDGRAKLVCLTASGLEAMRTGRRVITELEPNTHSSAWGAAPVGRTRCQTRTRALSRPP
jgi:Winged helix DNA-binding domain